MGGRAAVAVLALVALLAAACSSPSTPAATSSHGPLVLGTLVPTTGSMSAFGPPEQAGIALAIKDVNAAGGVLGQPVTLVQGDSGDPFNAVASQTVDRELEKKVSAIVGATGSSVTLTVIDKIVGAGVVELSPADSSTKLTGYDDRGLYLRLSPPDNVEASVLAAAIRKAGHSTLSVAAVRDSYATGLQDELEADFRKAGGKLIASVQYDGTATDLSGVASQLAAASADANVLIGFSETRRVLDALIGLHAGPDVVPVYVSDLALTGALTAGLTIGQIAGITGVRPGGPPPLEFVSRLTQQSPDLADIGYAAQSYDAVVLLALAADAAGSTGGHAIATSLPGVTSGTSVCNAYAECLGMLKAGRTIAYSGVSGTAHITADGDPEQATVGLFRYARPGRVPDAAASYTTVVIKPAAS